MYKYKIDPASIVDDTERTQSHPQMDGQTDMYIDHQLSNVMSCQAT